MSDSMSWSESFLRRRLGALIGLLSAIYLIPVIYVWLSSLGPIPLLINARTWSIFFYTHFIVFCTLGIFLQLYTAVVSRLFYVSVLIDFLTSIIIFMLLESLVTYALKRNFHSDWLILIPGLALSGFAVAVSKGKRLLPVS